MNRVDISEIEWYYRLRNELYHEGNGLTVAEEKVVAYAEIARELFSRLFERDLPDLTIPPLPEIRKESFQSLARRTQVHFADSTKGWFLINATHDGKKYFAATANAKGSCRLKTFDGTVPE